MLRPASLAAAGAAAETEADIAVDTAAPPDATVVCEETVSPVGVTVSAAAEAEGAAAALAPEGECRSAVGVKLGAGLWLRWLRAEESWLRVAVRPGADRGTPSRPPIAALLSSASLLSGERLLAAMRALSMLLLLLLLKLARALAFALAFALTSALTFALAASAPVSFTAAWPAVLLTGRGGSGSDDGDGSCDGLWTWLCI